MIRFIKVFIVVVFAILFSRAFFVTVLMHSYYTVLARDNRVRTEAAAPLRGVITDREGKVFATNILDSAGEMVRYYPDGEVAASIVGYLADNKGVTGLEKQYDGDLAGTAGERAVEETASGKDVKEISLSLPVNGKEIKTNLDMGLQAAVYRALKERLAMVGKAGSVVVSRVNGEVLALVSLPSFDPNLFVRDGKRGSEGGIYTDVGNVVSDTERKPLFNRAVGGTFAPGSVFKLVPALAGLSEGVLTKDDLIEDSGEIVVGKYRYGNWLFDKYGRTEGHIDVERALARSNDVFFYKLGERLGIDRLSSFAKKLGLGEKTGIDLPGEVAGLVPTPLWQEKEKGEPWFLGNTYNLVIGQGDLAATPLQINRMTAAVVSGEKCQPRLVGHGECTDLGVAEEYRRVVMEGMKQACESGGTGFPFFDMKGAVYCKTGTAQQGGEASKPHAWMTVVIPQGGIDSWVVVTVMLDEAGEGSEQAGPVARKIVDYWLSHGN